MKHFLRKVVIHGDSTNRNKIAKLLRYYSTIKYNDSLDDCRGRKPEEIYYITE